jgi:hypothetical protein
MWNVCWSKFTSSLICWFSLPTTANYKGAKVVAEFTETLSQNFHIPISEERVSWNSFAFWTPEILLKAKELGTTREDSLDNISCHSAELVTKHRQADELASVKKQQQRKVDSHLFPVSCWGTFQIAFPCSAVEISWLLLTGPPWRRKPVSRTSRNVSKNRTATGDTPVCHFWGVVFGVRTALRDIQRLNPKMIYRKRRMSYTASHANAERKKYNIGRAGRPCNTRITERKCNTKREKYPSLK